MSKFIHIIPIGLEKDRIIYLLQKFPPYRVYFLNYKSENKEESSYARIVEPVQKEIDSLIPLAEKKYITVSYEEFEELFLKIFEIMVKEKQQGNEVIVHISPGPRIASFASWIAASIMNSKIIYIRPAEYLPEGGKLISQGVLKVIEMFHFPVTLPSDSEAAMLEFLLDHKESMTGSLKNFVKNVGIESLGKNIKSLNSGIVKMSHSLRELKRKDYVKIKSVSRKRQVVELTDLGRLMARTYKILKSNGFDINTIKTS
jgi:predicted transcriptional regulator